MTYHTSLETQAAPAAATSPEICLMGVFEAAACNVRTPMGRLAAVCQSLELALPLLTDHCAARADLMAWAMPNLIGGGRAANAPEAVTAEGLARLREMRVILSVASSMLQSEASNDQVDALCGYLADVLEDVLREDLLDGAYVV